MKELSIEEKAKAYDEALKVLHKYDGANIMFTQDLKEEMFPELAESEDERIRKEMIDIIKSQKEQQCHIDSTKYDEMIAWLEKQSEHANFRNKIQIGDKVTRNEDGVLVNLSQLNRVAKKDEKQGEQKPADKIEPKFKVGDWIINPETRNVLQIKNVLLCGNKGNYEFDNSSMPIESVDRYYKQWTIQDAKDGDVLLYRDGQWIFIYKGIVTEDTFKYYALLSEKGITINDAAFSLLTFCITPATKEQRDFLFQKMKEVGYEWDANKKELKKIEQSPIDVRTTGYWHVEDVEQKPAWSEEDEERYLSCLQRLSTGNIEQPETVNTVWFKSLKNRVLLQPKKEWSEEDEKHLNRAIKILDASKVYTKSPDKYEDTINWLKSLIPQLKYYNDRIDIEVWKAKNGQWILKLNNEIVRGEWYNDAECIYKHFFYLSEIKSLRPQNTYNPYKAVVESIAAMVEKYASFDSNLQDFYDNVKVKCKDAKEYDSLFPQNTWKPSDEQMNTLDYYINADICNKDKEILFGLYAGLKKLREE